VTTHRDHYECGIQIDPEAERQMQEWAMQGLAEQEAAFDAEEAAEFRAIGRANEDYDPADQLCRELASPLPPIEDANRDVHDLYLRYPQEY
jgi:hypothetical protein